MPAIYPFRLDPQKGGLMSYGFDTIEQQRGAADYVDRVLKGEKPADLPVQAPTKYQLVINLKTAESARVRHAITPAATRRRNYRVTPRCPRLALNGYPNALSRCRL